MELYHLTEEEIKYLTNGELFMLANNFNVISFETYLKTIGFDADKLFTTPNKLDLATTSFLDMINQINESMSETFIPQFRELPEYENQALLDYSRSDFDVDMNYIGKSSPISIKEIIRKFNQIAIYSDKPYLIASSYDMTALFE